MPLYMITEKDLPLQSLSRIRSTTSQSIASNDSDDTLRTADTAHTRLSGFSQNSKLSNFEHDKAVKFTQRLRMQPDHCDCHSCNPRKFCGCYDCRISDHDPNLLHAHTPHSYHQPISPPNEMHEYTQYHHPISPPYSQYHQPISPSNVMQDHIQYQHPITPSSMYNQYKVVQSTHSPATTFKPGIQTPQTYSPSVFDSPQTPSHTIKVRLNFILFLNL